MTFGRFSFNQFERLAGASGAEAQAVRGSEPIDAAPGLRDYTRRPAVLCTSLFGATLMLALAGCHHHKKSPTSAPVFTAHDNFNDPMVRAKMPQLDENFRQTQLVAPPTPILAVAAGTLPLVYLTTQGGSVRIVDEADKSTVFGGAIAANTTIAVNAATGVLIGGKRVVSYPLPSDHKYSIYLETENGPNVFGHGTIRPGGPMPATLPSVQR